MQSTQYRCTHTQLLVLHSLISGASNSCAAGMMSRSSVDELYALLSASPPGRPEKAVNVSSQLSHKQRIICSYSSKSPQGMGGEEIDRQAETRVCVWGRGGIETDR